MSTCNNYIDNYIDNIDIGCDNDDDKDDNNDQFDDSIANDNNIIDTSTTNDCVYWITMGGELA